MERAGQRPNRNYERPERRAISQQQKELAETFPFSVWAWIVLYGDEGGYSPRRLPLAPCPFPPGSPGRIRNLARRIEAGEQLWHPADVVYYDFESAAKLLNRKGDT